MRKINQLVIIILLCQYPIAMTAQQTTVTDSSKPIVHLIDGDISEWHADKFETDKDTRIQYAFDNDKEYIYLAMKVPTQPLQMKMIMQGMKLFIDRKGKKREGTGIEFPIKKEGGMGGFRGGGRPGSEEGATEGGERQRPDIKAMRDNLTAMMIFLKTFGLEGKEDRSQIINAENEVNISFNWDEGNDLCIEYLVPLKFIGSYADLNGKPLGIGWKIAGTEQQPGDSGFGSVPSANAGRGGASGRTGGGAGNLNRNLFPGGAGNRNSEQNIWTKYIMHN